MRCVIVAILVAVPVAIITWAISRGIYVEAPGAGGDALIEQARSKAGGPGATADAASPDAVLRRLFAEPLATAKVSGTVELYDTNGLFDYIDGAAPIFIERGFRKLAAAEMTTEDGGELTCDVYDMQSSENAASIYDKEQPPKADRLEVGDAGRTSAMAVMFRQGQYYVKLTAFDGPSEAALPGVAAALSTAMR